MPSHEPFMAIRAVDLRHELASRGLPTKGLKKDLAFRLAISENPCPFHALPHSTIALPSVASNQEVDLVTMHGSDIPTTEVKRRGPERSSPSRTDKSLPTSHDRQHGDDAWSIRSLVQISTTFNNALLWILLIVFLSCILWTYLPTVDKNYLVMRVNTGRDFVSSEINSGYRSLFRGVQSIGGINEAELIWFNFPDHYKALGVPRDAFDSIVTCYFFLYSFLFEKHSRFVFMIESEYYVPKSLTAPSTAYQVPMNLPITVQGNQAHGEETFTISTVYDGAEHSKVFWLELRDQVHKLDEILAQSHFGTIEDEDLTQLELGIENAHVISAADVRLTKQPISLTLAIFSKESKSGQNRPTTVDDMRSRRTCAPSKLAQHPPRFLE
ncbi:MAG: hypothetical protein ASARMPRED_009266 [Alectoria sarmentosa]|nr:MAG: hypothetical protein ASARMPRED_009266 [Alectoria sarmentosa]